MESGTIALPKAVQAFLAGLNQTCPGAKTQIEKGGDKAGNWWIDLESPAKITVEWRPKGGFGLSFGDDVGYGEGPTEIFQTPERAADRVAQLLGAEQAGASSGLKALRELYGKTQEEVAAELHIQQEAVSRFEGRPDAKIETISRYVHALGGQLKLQAVFPDGQISIYPAATLTHSIPPSTKDNHGPAKPRRPARA